MRPHYVYYHLTSGQYGELVDRAAGSCDMCRQPARPRHNKTALVIDHDHQLGWRAVRGLICYGCNTALGKLENGAASCAKHQAALTYLSAPWYASAGITEFTCPPDCELSLHRR